VGYTNAGKSTLFNALTRSNVTTSSRLFATLDPTVRALELPSRRPALLSDTVGFIRKLPPHLVAAFRATLEELEGASLLLHVTDASHPHHEKQDAAVEALLETLGLCSAPRLHVWNKIDLVDAPEAKRYGATPTEVAVSAHTGQGLEEILRRVDEALADDLLVEAQFDLPNSHGRQLAMLHRCGEVLETRFENDRIHVRARVAKSLLGRLASSPQGPEKTRIGG